MKSRVQGAAWGGASQEKRQVSQAKPQNARKGPKIVNLQPGLVYMPEALDMDTQKWLIGKEKRRYIYLSDTAFGVGKVEGGVGEGFYEEKDGRFVLNQGNRGRVIISPDTFPTSERFRTLCLTLLESARAVDTTLPMMEPNTALINYYNEKAFFKWHKVSW